MKHDMLNRALETHQRRGLDAVARRQPVLLQIRQALLLGRRVPQVVLVQQALLSAAVDALDARPPPVVRGVRVERCTRGLGHIRDGEDALGGAWGMGRVSQSESESGSLSQSQSHDVRVERCPGGLGHVRDRGWAQRVRVRVVK
eukprot:TRINITY_DN1750_c0_g3_i1.p2 TRINITY_DN1750_c0_g3~~TRINITY_DN1750_c0_g3_i1.p2  ORF type:complete len:144 (+),score=8.14 TRINITY_DN1750_c0_g3_i1:1557-1988(+)